MSTAAPSAELLERASKIRSTIFAGLSRVGQVEVARRLNVAESTVSKAKGDELETASKICAAADLKVVPAHYECVDPKVMESLITLAGMKIDSLRRQPGEIFQQADESSRTLQW